VICGALLVCASSAAAVSPGDPDPSFGAGGLASYALGQGPSASSEFDAVALQPDGKIVVGGSATDSDGHPALLVARLGIDGALDPAFGDGGKVLVQFGTGDSPMSSVAAIALQPDGKILAGGTATGAPYLLARLTASGSFDPLFGDGGVVALARRDLTGGETLDPGGVTAVAIQPDGKILTGGGAGHDDCCSAGLVARLGGLTGAPDPLFGDGGLAPLWQPTTAGRHAPWGVSALALQPDGRIVVGGVGPDPASPSYGAVMVARLSSVGGIDSSLNSGGMFFDSPFASDEGHGAGAFGLAVEPNGRIVLGGSASGSDHPGSRLVAAGLNGLNGTLDPGFASGGVLVSRLGGGSAPGAEALGLALQPDGKIVLGGFATDSASKNEFLLARLDGSNGAFDPSFGNEGKVLWQAGGSGGSEVRAVAVQPDGRIVAAGLVGSSVAVARLMGDTPQQSGGNTSPSGGNGQTSAGPSITVATLSSLGISPARFEAADHGPSIAKTIGAQVSYENSQAATTMFTVLKRTRGVHYKGRCMRRARHRHGRACARWVAVGRFTHADGAGLNSFHFTGRVYNRKLRPGRYKLRARPRFAGPAGKAIEVSFRIVR